MKLDIHLIRKQYPALGDGTAYLDGAGGTQLPDSVIDAIADAHRSGLGNAHGEFPASRRADSCVAGARLAVADLVGGRPDSVVLGPNMTTLTYRIAGALAKTWRPGDEIVLSQLDHDANVRPWVQFAERQGVRVRWAAVDAATGELPAEQYGELINERTRLIAVSAASNVLGTRPDVRTITDIAHRHGALAYVDGVAAAPHVPIDMGALGADFFATSAYKWSGPHIGAVAAAGPGLLESLEPDKLAASSNAVPERFETGTLAFADLAGVAAAVDHTAGLAGTGTAGSRRERVLDAMAAVEAHEQAESAVLMEALGAMPHVRLFGRPASRTPVAYFRVAGHTPQQVAAHLAARGVNVWHGHAYAWELTKVLGVRHDGGAVRASLAPYNDADDVARLLSGIAELAP